MWFDVFQYELQTSWSMPVYIPNFSIQMQLLISGHLEVSLTTQIISAVSIDQLLDHGLCKKMERESNGNLYSAWGFHSATFSVMELLCNTVERSISLRIFSRLLGMTWRILAWTCKLFCQADRFPLKIIIKVVAFLVSSRHMEEFGCSIRTNLPDLSLARKWVPEQLA